MFFTNIQIHNSFARADPFSIEQTDPNEESEDVFHFVAYIQKNGFIYELDGLKDGPIRHIPCNPEEFTNKGNSKSDYLPFYTCK
jgi:ubiquitin carboxyl-terminal hydrolase L5